MYRKTLNLIIPFLRGGRFSARENECLENLVVVRHKNEHGKIHLIILYKLTFN